MAGPRGYSSYRGRIPKGKILLAVILALAILVAVGYMLIQRFLVYDDSGKPQLRLPEPTQEEPAPTPEVDLVIEPVKPAVTAELRAVQLPQTALADWDWQGVIDPYRESGENNALAVTVKAAGGQLYLDPSANQATGQSVPAATAETIGAIIQGDKRTIARISCFPDTRAAGADVDGMGLKNTGGFLFYDGNNKNWLDPAKEKTVEYLASLVGACAAMGFDEILLTDVTYPTVGKLDKIDFGALPDGGRPAVLTRFLAAMRTALAEYPDVMLSIETPAAVISTGSDEAAGLVLTELAGSVDRIYAVTTEDEAPALETAVAAAAEDTQLAFVPELTASPASGSYLLLPVG